MGLGSVGLRVWVRSHPNPMVLFLGSWSWSWILDLGSSVFFVGFVVFWSNYVWVICLILTCSSYLILSYLITSYRIASYLIVSSRIFSYLLVSYRILSYLIVSYRILSYLIVFYISFRFVKDLGGISSVDGHLRRPKGQMVQLILSSKLNPALALSQILILTLTQL